MVIVPNSKVILIKNPLKLDNNNEIMFASANAQETYFKSLPKLEFDNLTYIRKDGVLRIPTDESASGTTYEDLLQYNFCMYQNTHYDNKWFYAFITDYTWVNPSVTELKIETAYYQTWQHDLVFMDSFIEREHVNDDTIGKHTLPENVELGEYINQEVPLAEETSINFLYTTGTHKNYVVFAVTELGLGITQEYHDNYNGTFSGLMYLVFPTFGDAQAYLVERANHITEDNIVAGFMVPYELGIQAPSGSTFTWHTFQTSAVTHFEYGYIQDVELPETLRSVSISKPSVLDKNYTPKNKKLLTSPYVFFNVSNNAGSVANYQYEYFTNINGSYSSTCSFIILGAVGIGCSIKLIPQHYKYGNTALNTAKNNYMESLDAGKLPTCTWTNDTFTNWLTQNAVNIPLNVLEQGAKIVGGGLTGNIGAIGSGLSGIANQVSQVYQHSLVPPTGKGGVNQGDLMFGNKTSFTIYKMSIKEENAKMIDGYFSMFGYRVNRLGTPHLHVRQYYDYIKTIDVNIEGNIPEPDLNEIRKMFNNGIRFWHDTTKYLDFSVNNAII